MAFLSADGEQVLPSIKEEAKRPTHSHARGPAIMEMRWNPTAVLIISTLLALTFAESLSLASSYNKVITIRILRTPYHNYIIISTKAR